ncbi:MAG: aldose 1-epimerase family protein [Croceibacterium sp.]
MSAPVAIASAGLSAAIDPLGAELVSLTDSGGRQYLTDADPAFWTGHAPVLFPIIGRLRDDIYRLGDDHYRLAKHGFARKSAFEVVEAEPARARFRLTDGPETRAAYPFAFELEMAFALRGMTLAMTATVRNPGGAPLPFSFGFHPAFAWPLPGGAAKADHRVMFAEPEPEPIRRIDTVTAMLLPDAQPTPVTGNVLTPRGDLFEADALIWDRLHSRALSFGADGGAWLDIAFPDCPNLGIWQKPGAAFLAIEPWHGFNDAAGFEGDFRTKPGVIELAPGHEHRFRMDVTVRPG